MVKLSGRESFALTENVVAPADTRICIPTLIPMAMLALAVIAGPAMAGNAPVGLDSICSSSGINVEYKSCLHQRYLEADRELNRVWKRVIAEIRTREYPQPPQRRKWEKRLREAQRNWVRFKDIDCKEAVLFEWWGGTGAGGAISLCLIRHTVLRTEDLRERYFPGEYGHGWDGNAADAGGRTTMENASDLGLGDLEALEKLE